MSETVLDASVLIAVLKGERYDEGLVDVIKGAVISSVSLAEVISKANDSGLPHAALLYQTFVLLDRVEPFTEKQARRAGDLRVATRGAGLSLGDRACLALALDLGASVYTADHAWTRISVGCKVHLIR